MVIGRRGFFGFMGGAGVAAPSLAKEAASKMGLQAGGSGSMAAKIAALQSESENFSAPNSPMSPEGWLRHELKGMWGHEAVTERFEEACNQARHLDSDLASMRSLSPSVAYGIQVDRCYRRLTQRRKSYLEIAIENAGFGR